MRKTPLTLLAMGFCLLLSAQEQVGLNPPSLKWMQINTPSGKVIYPVGLKKEAIRAAGLMEYGRLKSPSLTGQKATQRVPVIIQNQSTLPAGFSTPAPWRNELYLATPYNPFLGPAPWLDALTIHEYRHTQQFYMANQGFTRLYQILMGQTGWLLSALISQPLWYREGDATVTETLYTGAGRGRLPSFQMELKALRLSGMHFNYEKGVWYSRRDRVPNPYRIGYYMNIKARKDYGEDIWTKVLNDTYQKTMAFYPFSRSLKKFTGFSTPQFYQETVRELDSLWKIEDEKRVLSPSLALTDSVPEVYTNYRFPNYLPDGSIVIEKSGYKDIRTFYQIKHGEKAKRLFSPGIYTTDHSSLTATGWKMTWAESSFDPRWINRDFSIIKVYDVQTGKKHTLKRKTRYFMPAISYDGNRIAVGEHTTLNKHFLTILNTETGEVLNQISHPENYQYTQPRWLEGDDALVVLVIGPQGNALQVIDAKTGEVQREMPFSYKPMTKPFPVGNRIYFAGGFDEVNDIYAWDLSTDKVFRITSSRFGAFDPAVSADGSRLVYSDYTALGYVLKEITISPETGTEVFPEEMKATWYHEPLLKLEGENLNTMVFPDTFTAKPYHAGFNGLLNINGWFPLPNHPEYGAEFYAQNIMSTMKGTFGAGYNVNERSLRAYGRLTYAALYPIFNLEGTYGTRSSELLQIREADTAKVSTDWREHGFAAGVSFPFRLTQGVYNAGMEVSGAYRHTWTQDYEPGGNDLEFGSAEVSFSAFRTKPMAARHVKPRLAQSISAKYQQSITGDEVNANKISAAAALFFPGLFPTHSLNGSIGYQREDQLVGYRYADLFINPRGYRPQLNESQYRISANYEFPIAHPDWSLGSIAFIQRIRTNVFYDFSLGSLEGITRQRTSAGVELLFDMKIFRVFEMGGGLQYAYAFDLPDARRRHRFNVVVARFEFAN